MHHANLPRLTKRTLLHTLVTLPALQLLPPSKVTPSYVLNIDRSGHLFRPANAGRTMLRSMLLHL